MFQPFRNRAAASSPFVAGEPFPYPIPHGPRIAVFATGFAETATVTLAADASELPRLDVQALAAPMEIIREIDPTCWTPEYPLIVLSDDETGLMSEYDRNYIWERFGMPVFEYLIETSGRIIARECEAHDGLHIEEDFSSDNLEITEEACPCGRPGQRIIGPAAIDTAEAII
jgi:hypothetical protein